jgi:hypothetical protein
MTFDELTTAIKAQINAGVDGKLQGGLVFDLEPPQCEVSPVAVANAASACDAKVESHALMFECSGRCEADANSMPSCPEHAQLTCIGTAPGFECNGLCVGGCELAADAVCPGTCKGTCEVADEGECDGQFTPSTEPQSGGTCSLDSGARCRGLCHGTCELTAPTECDGRCRGECEYTAASGRCPTGTVTRCEPNDRDTVQCAGRCSAEAIVPQISAECEATAKAAASLTASCAPPKIDLKFTLTPSAQTEFRNDLPARAAFDSKLRAVTKAFASLSATRAKLQRMVSFEDLGGSGASAIDATFSRALEDDPSVAEMAALTCALVSFERMPQTLSGAALTLNDSFVAIGQCEAALTGADESK